MSDYSDSSSSSSHSDDDSYSSHSDNDSYFYFAQDTGGDSYFVEDSSLFSYRPENAAEYRIPWYDYDREDEYDNSWYDPSDSFSSSRTDGDSSSVDSTPRSGNAAEYRIHFYDFYEFYAPEQDEQQFLDFPDIDDLPILVSDYMEEEDLNIPCGWTPKVKTLLIGVYDVGNDKSPLCCFRGFEDSIVRKIVSYFSAEYTSHIKLTLPARNIGRIYDSSLMEDFLCRYRRRIVYSSDVPNNAFYAETQDLSTDYVSFSSCGHITFPSPNDRVVNMMPFRLGDKESLPDDLQCYYNCIQQCPIDKSEIGSICYLTIHESFVRAQASQGREGIHIETPGIISLSSSSLPAFHPGREHYEERKHFYEPDRFQGGMYFASNVSNISIMYNALIDKDVPGIVDQHGGCDHLRRYLGPGTKLDAGQLVWMTDRTPHETLTQEEDGYRQFFTVVTSKVSHWFAQHSTMNPRVDLPDDVVVVKENKFVEGLVEDGYSR